MPTPSGQQQWQPTNERTEQPIGDRDGSVAPQWHTRRAGSGSQRFLNGGDRSSASATAPDDCHNAQHHRSEQPGHSAGGQTEGEGLGAAVLNRQRFR